VRFDLCASVFCLLDCGAPHGIGVLSPWSAAPTTCQVGSAAQPPSRPPLSAPPSSTRAAGAPTPPPPPSRTRTHARLPFTRLAAARA
jgi:hypothetical protein